MIDNRVQDHWWEENDFVSSGVIVFGADEVTVRGNELAGNDAGLYVFGGSVNAKLIGNTFAGGFGTPIFDGGDDTKLPAPFVP